MYPSGPPWTRVPGSSTSLAIARHQQSLEVAMIDPRRLPISGAPGKWQNRGMAAHRQGGEARWCSQWRSLSEISKLSGQRSCYLVCRLLIVASRVAHEVECSTRAKEQVAGQTASKPDQERNSGNLKRARERKHAGPDGPLATARRRGQAAPITPRRRSTAGLHRATRCY